MARIYPDRPLPETQSNAERVVFYALKELLPNDYVVLHSVPLYQKENKAGRLQDKEIDFLVLHPDKGAMVLEVKGGGIQRDPESGCWISKGENGINEIKNPYDQAKTNCYVLLDDLKNSTTTRKHNCRLGHAVWFPDVDLGGVELGISPKLKMITLDQSALDSPEASIARLFKNSLGEDRTGGPGEDGVKAIREFLSPSWEIPVKLSVHIKREKGLLLEATRRQYQVLSLLQRYTQALICGPAGSGKTFLAVEKARQIVEKSPSSKVLFLCYNVCLAERIRQAFMGSDQVEVFNFHGLCVEMCKRGNVPIPKQDPRAPKDHLFQYDLPEALLYVLDIIDDRYDAIIVDEGQDFESTWWLPVQGLLKDFCSGLFYIFYDANQALYQRKLEFPLEGEPFLLFENCRNTKLIHQEVMKYYQGDVEPEARGPEGRKPEVITIADDEQEVDVVARLIKRLINEEGVKPHEIVLLTPRSKQNSALGSKSYLAGYQVKWLTDKASVITAEDITCSTIYSFKGLESPVVVVCETSHIHQDTKVRVCYVAMSRAITQLFIIE